LAENSAYKSVFEYALKTYSTDKFDTYMHRTDSEKVFIRNLSNFSILEGFDKAATYAKNSAYINFPKSSLEDGQGDAFRHSFWSAEMTSVGGSQKALEFGTAHEDGQGNPFYKKSMDLYNNSFGVNFAVAHPNLSRAEQEQMLKTLSSDALIIDIDVLYPNTRNETVLTSDRTIQDAT
jgi:hypothetical protein